MSSPRPFITDEMKEKLKQETDILALLKSLGATEIKETPNPTQFKAKCIFADCKTSKKEDYPLSIDTSRKLFNCFHCGRGGDIYKLIGLAKGLSFYDSKVFLMEWNRTKLKSCVQETQSSSSDSQSDQRPAEQQGNIREFKPFGRRLTGLRVQDIPALEEKGITPQTAERFGVGYCSQGLMKGRIVVPIFDSTKPGTEAENILGYAGYSVTKRQQEIGDWRFPDGFPKGQHLFNLNRVREDTKHSRETLERHGIIVVESFWNVLKLDQAGIKNAVALMGCALTPDQEKLLLQTTDKVKLWLDEDEAGQAALNQILRSPKEGGKNGLMYKTHVKIISPAAQGLPAEKVKPYNFNEDEIKEILMEKQ